MGKFIIILLFCTSALFAQVDSLAQSEGWTKVEITWSPLFADSIQYLELSPKWVIDEPNQKIEFTYTFRNKDGTAIYTAQLPPKNATTLFDYEWGTFPAARKTFILNRTKLTEQAYE